MTEKTRLGLDVLWAGLLLGVLGDVLLRAEPWGLNVLLWVAALAAAVAALVRRKGAGAGAAHDGRWLLPCALCLAAGFAWRDSLTLRALDAALILVLLALNFLRVRGGSVRLAGMTDYVLAGLASAVSAVFGWVMLLAKEIGWKELPLGGYSRQAAAVLRGLAIAVPLLLVFGALFVAADAAYEGLVLRAFRVDGERAASHAAFFTVCAVLSAGFLCGMFLGRTPPHAGRPPAYVVLGLGGTWVETTEGATADGTTPAATSRFRPTLGAVETGVALGLLNALFFSFVAVQLRYFFGGAPVVLDAAGPTYSEYARRGFFELASVAALVLPLLLAADWLARKETRAQARLFRGLAAGLLLMLFVIMASALGRMRLYQSEYGQTELRFYTTAFMFWLAAVFVWFALTVLRGRRERFACGALVAALVVAAALHVFNPNDHIVRANAALAGGRRGFDSAYAASLGADAVPALLEALPSLGSRDRAYVSERLLGWAGATGGDWRSWNRARSAARRAIRAQEPTLREWAKLRNTPEEKVAAVKVTSTACAAP
jgi:hypothetical protein